MSNVLPSQDIDPHTRGLTAPVWEIITYDAAVFFGTSALRQYDYELGSVQVGSQLPELDGELVPASEPVVKLHYSATLKQGIGGWESDVVFMRLGDDLIPLNSHANAQRRNFCAYSIDEASGRLVGVSSLARYVTDRLPNQVVLYRILSETEARKFANGDTSLGSGNGIIWNNAVHTTLHNPTNEMQGAEGYTHMIGMVFTREQLQQIVGTGAADIGTYKVLLKDRDPNSPFPFDMEFRFDASTAELLLRAYRRWSAIQRVPYLPAPF